jgi:RND family efflux transporter MFP subunit
MKYINISYILLIILILFGCKSDKTTRQSAEETIPVVITMVKKTESQKIISLSGNIEGYKTVRLGFMVAGKIDYIAVNEGEAVSKGMLLASLDPTSYAIAKELVDIQADQVQDEYNRLKQMHDSSSLSESDFAKVSYGLKQARAQQKLHTKNLSDTRLYSPIEGVLLKKLAETGEITGVGIPVFAVSDIRKVKVSAFIPENELQNIRLGQNATVIVSSTGNNYEGRIIEVGSAADPASRAFQVKIEVDNPGLKIRPGMIADVKITTDLRSGFLSIPIESMRHDFNGQSFVFVADTLGNKAFRRNVSTGQIIGSSIEVTSGLEEKEAVVSGGQQKLVNGSAITIVK